MERLCLLLFCIFACNNANRIVFPDEFDKMTQPSTYGYYTPRRLVSSNPRRDEYTYYQTVPPLNYPINSINPYEPQRTTINQNAGVPQPTPGSLAEVLPPYWRSHVNNIISNGVVKFAIDMDRVISNTSTIRERDIHKNVVFSPLSLAGTLAMVLLASSGQTFQEVAKILGLQSGVDISRHSELVHQMFGSLTAQINTKKSIGEPVTNYASGIFVQEGYPIRPEFQAISEKVYKSEIINLDFQKHAKQAQDTVNAWVNNRTNGKITNILTDPPNDFTKVLLASALYFIGEWNQYFAEEITKRKPFNIEPGLTVEVDMMYNAGHFPFHEDKQLGVKVIALPYKGNEVTMYILLPQAEGATALKNFKNYLTPEIIDSLIGKMRNQSCLVALPRMKLSSTLGLKEALRFLGLVSLFEPAFADLSLLSPGRGEHIQTPNPTITSRLGDDEPATVIGLPPKKNHFKYVDKTRGYTVEQWATGFDIRRLPRRRRQNRPIDEAFLDFVNSQSFPNFGLDNLRNSHSTVNPHLFADDVLHKVEININEKGTEAAAATAVTINRSGDHKRLVANRPFLFFIRHDPSKLIWFWGTVNKPEPFYSR